MLVVLKVANAWLYKTPGRIIRRRESLQARRLLLVVLLLSPSPF